MARIVSLIASATEIVYALGLGDQLVARSHECDFPPEVLRLPVCTAPRFPVNGTSAEIDQLVRETRRNEVSVYEVFDHVLETVNPTHILTQVQCEVCAVSLRDVERSIAATLPGRPQVVALNPNTLDDIWQDFQRAGEALGADWRPVVDGLASRMRGLAAECAAAPEKPLTACVEWLEPLMPSGNWMPELVRMAGGIPAEWRNWEELAAADPDVIVAMPCGFDLARTESEMHWLAGRPGWKNLRAVRNGRVCLADGNQYFNRPGPRIADSLEILAEMLHPERERSDRWKSF